MPEIYYKTTRKKMLIVSYWMELRVPNGGAREEPKEPMKILRKLQTYIHLKFIIES